MPITINQFAVENYLTQPLGGNKFLISLSGVAFVDLTGQQGSGWHRDVGDMYVSLANALRVTGRTPRQGYHFEFALQQWTSLVTPNAFTDLNQAVDFGVAVDAFQVDWQQVRRARPSMSQSTSQRATSTRFCTGSATC
jgi:hypothetical protein